MSEQVVVPERSISSAASACRRARSRPIPALRSSGQIRSVQAIASAADRPRHRAIATSPRACGRLTSPGVTACVGSASARRAIALRELGARQYGDDLHRDARQPRDLEHRAARHDRDDPARLDQRSTAPWMKESGCDRGSKHIARRAITARTDRAPPPVPKSAVLALVEFSIALFERNPAIALVPWTSYSMDQFAKETLPISLEEEMRRSYLDYAMSVIVGRALPDVRDGLKPVHRRVLYAMHEANNHWNRSYVKCARVVGEVMGKYHPHGDQRDLRHARAHGAGFLAALPADRRPGQLRLDRWRQRGGDALHRVSP